MKIPSFTSVSSSSVQGPYARGASGASEPAPSQTSHIGRRLRAWAARMEKRLENALASRDLTEAQRSALETLNRKFHAKLGQLIDTYLGGKDSGTTLQGEVELFENSVNDVLSGSKGPKGVSADPGTGLDTLA
jgi:hypothetical protein